MQTPSSLLPTSCPAIDGQTNADPEALERQPGAPSVIVTKDALEKIIEEKNKLGLPVKGLRVIAIPRSPLRAAFHLRFVPAEEVSSSSDIVVPLESLDLYISSDTAPYLEGATIDVVFTLFNSEIKVEAPLRRIDTPEGRLALQIHQVLIDEVIPMLASHGGGAVLQDVRDGIVFLELTGGCQGCSMAGATLKDGIESSLRGRFPEIVEVRDVTRHASGKNPYFRQ